MRVLLTTDTVGGVWTFTKELAVELIRQHHSVAMVSFGQLPSPEQSEWSARTADRHSDKFQYHASSVPLEWMKDNERAYSAGEAELLRIADQFAPDILHTNQFCFGKLPLSIPKIATAHSDVLSWAQACKPDGLERSPWLSRYCEMVQEGLHGADAVVAPTSWMMNALANNFEVRASRYVIMNGRSIIPVRSADGRALRAVTAGRLWDEAKNIVSLESVNSPIPIVVAGSFAFDVVSAPRIPANLEFRGVLSEAALLELFNSSSIYIACSVYEPFGLAAVEAASCGCAVICNDIPSLREVWADAAIYYSDTQSLEAVLHTFHSSPALLAEARSRSLLRARRLTARNMAQQYRTLYKQVIARSHASPDPSAQAKEVALHV
jgi:glycosyltransferase involved in cell wall biosynthesis